MTLPSLRQEQVELAFNRSGTTIIKSNGGDAFPATTTDYDNSISGLTATDVQDAIDEIAAAFSSPQQESFIATAGQTAFVITGPTPIAPTKALIVVNNLTYEYGSSNDFTISGSNITWYNNNYTMQNGDAVQVFYDGGGTVSGPGTYSELIQVHSDVNYGLRRVQNVGATGAYRLNFYIPMYFEGTLSVKVIGYPVSGAGGTGKDIDISGEYTSAAGQSYQEYTFADTTSTYDLGTDDTRVEIDVTSLMTNLAPGTDGGIFMDHKGIGGSINYIGVLVTSVS